MLKLPDCILQFLEGGNLSNYMDNYTWTQSPYGFPSTLIHYLSLKIYLSNHAEGRWVHLFFNGVVERVTASVVARDVLLDKDSNWILRYNRFLGNCTPFETKLWGILDGLLILLRKWYKRATVQIDNLEVIEALTNKGMEDSSITVRRMVQITMHSEEQWWIQYVARAKHLAADRMTKLV